MHMGAGRVFLVIMQPEIPGMAMEAMEIANPSDQSSLSLQPPGTIGEKGMAYQGHASAHQWPVVMKVFI